MYVLKCAPRFILKCSHNVISGILRLACPWNHHDMMKPCGCMVSGCRTIIDASMSQLPIHTNTATTTTGNHAKQLTRLHRPACAIATAPANFRTAGLPTPDSGPFHLGQAKIRRLLRRCECIKIGNAAMHATTPIPSGIRPPLCHRESIGNAPGTCLHPQQLRFHLPRSSRDQTSSSPSRGHWQCTGNAPPPASRDQTSSSPSRGHWQCSGNLPRSPTL